MKPKNRLRAVKIDLSYMQLSATSNYTITYISRLKAVIKAITYKVRSFCLKYWSIKVRKEILYMLHIICSKISKTRQIISGRYLIIRKSTYRSSKVDRSVFMPMMTKVPITKVKIRIYFVSAGNHITFVPVISQQCYKLFWLTNIY